MSATHRSRWAVECGKEAVARRTELPALEAFELPADQIMMLVEDVSPSAVPHLGSHTRRAHDVGEYQCCYHTVGIRTAACPRQKLLDLVDQCIRVSDEDEMVSAAKLNQLGAWDQGCQFPTEFDGYDLVIGPMQKEGGRLDRGNDITNVGHHRLTKIVTDHTGSDGGTLQARELFDEAFVTRAARRQHRHTSAAPVHRQVVRQGLCHLVNRFLRPAVSTCSCREHNERGASLGMFCTKQHRDQSAVLDSKHSRTLGLCGIVHCEGVTDLRFRVWKLVHRHGIRKARATTIK